MRKLGQKGIATIAAVIAIAAVAGAATGTPIAVDEIDTNPNSPLYSLERAGERIKEATYAGGISWNLQRAKERTKEYRAVARNEVPNNHLNLLEDAGNRISKAAKRIDSGKELQKVKETLQFHEQVLNEIRRKTPDKVNATISFATSNADRMKTVLDDIEPSEIREKGGIPDQAAEKLEQVQQKTQEMKSLVKQAEKGRIPDRLAVQQIELQTAEALATKLTEAVEKGKLGKHTNLVDDVQNHLDLVAQAAGDNRGLRRAIEAVKKHIKVLENVKGKVPEPAKEAIQDAIDRSMRGLEELENIMEKGGPGRVGPSGQENIAELREDLRKAATSFKRKQEKFEQEIENIRRWYEDKKEQMEKRFENSESKWQRQVEKEMEEIEQRFRESLNRKEDIIDNLRKGKPIENPGEFAPGLSKILENLLPQKTGEGGERLPGQIGPPENIGPSKNIGPPEEIMEKVREKLRERMNEVREKLGEKVDQLEEKFGENFEKASEKYDEQLKKARERFKEKIKKVEERREKAEEQFRERIERIVERLDKVLPGNRSPESIVKEVLGSEGLPEDLVELKPEGESIPFVHDRGKPPWAGAPEFAPENGKERDNINFEIPENEEKIENKGGAYELMGAKLPNQPVSYSVNPTNAEGISEPAVVTEISTAFETWDDHTDKELFEDEVTTTDKRGFEQDGANTVSFAPLDIDTAAAMARVWYSGDTITEFDVVFNSKREYGVDPDGEDPQTIDGFDLQAITTHEAGHTLGLMDLEDSDYSGMTMYYSSDPGSTIKISLESGDIAGLHELYGS